MRFATAIAFGLITVVPAAVKEAKSYFRRRLEKEKLNADNYTVDELSTLLADKERRAREDRTRAEENAKARELVAGVVGNNDGPRGKARPAS